MILTLHSELREVEPTGPDENGDRWRRVEGTGRVRWECGCGMRGPWKPADQAVAEAHEHAEIHTEET